MHKRGIGHSRLVKKISNIPNRSNAESLFLAELQDTTRFFNLPSYLGVVTWLDNGNFLVATTSVMNFATRIILIGTT